MAIIEKYKVIQAFEPKTTNTAKNKQVIFHVDPAKLDIGEIIQKFFMENLLNSEPLKCLQGHFCSRSMRKIRIIYKKL